MNFKIFLLIFALSIFLSKYPSIFSDISVKSKYRYIRNYRYFVPWVRVVFLVSENDFFLNRKSQIFWLFLFKMFILEI